MPTQRCPNCGFDLDTAAFISGAKVPCPRCKLSMEIVRSDVSMLRAARPATGDVKKAAGAETALFGGPEPIPAHQDSGPPVASDPGTEVAPTVVRAALQIPGYQLLQVIGRGGMGEVWQARQLSLGREVAIKILAQNLAAESDFVKRFEKEAAALAALSHPGIVQIIDRGAAENVPYFVMEYVQGQSLRDLMEAKKLGPAEALKIVVQVGTAIEYAHQRGVIHRDLKPENILIDTEGRIKVADFGLAGIRDDRFNVTRTAMTMGTLNYMAPEQRKDAKAVDARADIFSLGVMLYEMLCGEPPVGRFKLPSERVPGLDVRVDHVVVKALESEPDARFSKASEMTHALEGLLSTVSLPASALPDAPLPVPIPSTPPSAPAPAANATRPDGPANVATRPPRDSAVEMVRHVRRGWRIARRLFFSLAFVIGTLAIVQLLTGRNIVTVDDEGLALFGGRLNILGRGAQHRDAGAVATLPPDTRGDVAVALDLHGPLPGDAVVESPLTPGSSGSLIALDAQWTPGPDGLVARAFGRLEAEGERPRATLEEPSFRLRDVTAEVTVSVNPTPPPGYAPKTPRAILFFHSEEVMIQLAMELGDAPVYRLLYKYTDANGELKQGQSGDSEFNQAVPPAPGTAVTLRLVAKAGMVTVLADNKPILKRSLKLPDNLVNQLGRIGLQCEEATCTFKQLHVDGLAEKNRALLKDDQHDHTVHAPEARAP